MKWFVLVFIFLGVAFAGVLIDEKVSSQVNKNNETDVLIPVEVIHDEEISKEDELRTLHKYKKKKKPGDDEYRGDSHHHDRDKIVIQVKPTEPAYVPKCPNPHVEEWSYSDDCDVQCDNQGVSNSDYYDGVGGFYRSEKSSYRCRRMVSDVLLEEGYTNITRREDLGYKPEPKEEYLRRTKRNFDSHHHHSSPEYVVVEKEPHYHRPAGACVCRRGYARLRGRCIKHSQCPQLNCPVDMPYVACAPCPKTCANFAEYDYTTLGCVCSPRCVCKNDLILSPYGTCIPSSQCTQFKPA